MTDLRSDLEAVTRRHGVARLIAEIERDDPPWLKALVAEREAAWKRKPLTERLWLITSGRVRMYGDRVRRAWLVLRGCEQHY